MQIPVKHYSQDNSLFRAILPVQLHKISTEFTTVCHIIQQAYLGTQLVLFLPLHNWL